MPVPPILVTGVALASAGAIVASQPVVAPAEQSTHAVSASAQVPAKKTLTVDQVRLLALPAPDPITYLPVGAVVAFLDGWGGGIGADDPYYPSDDEIYVDGFTGVGYYLTDQVLLSLGATGLPVLSPLAEFAYYNVSTYLFEVGGVAALHASLAEATGGPDTAFAQILRAFFNPGSTTMTTAAAATPFAAPAPDPLGDIPAGIVDAFVDGWGGGIGPDDPYYPSDDEIYVDGFTGVGYYLTDQLLLSAAATGLPLVAPLAEFGYYNVTTYLYEVGGPAALHVALAEATGGPDTPFAQVLKAIFNPGAATQEVEAEDSPGIEARSVSTDDGIDSGAVHNAEESTGPEVLPKKPAAVVDLPVSDPARATSVEVDFDDSTDEETTEDEATEKQETKPAKKGPKLNVKKDSPLSGLADKVDGFKKDLDNAVKRIGADVKKPGEVAKAESGGSGSEPGSDAGGDAGADSKD